MSKQECTEALNMRNQHLFEKSNAKLVFAVKQTKNTFKQHQNRIETEKRTKLTLKTIGNSLANLFKPTKKNNRIFTSKSHANVLNTSQCTKSTITAKSCSNILTGVTNEIPNVNINTFQFRQSQSNLQTRQPCMGVHAYSLKVKKNIRHPCVSSDPSIGSFDNDAQKSIQMHAQHAINFSPLPIKQSGELSDMISVSLLKNRKMHSASILCSRLRGFSTDV